MTADELKSAIAGKSLAVVAAERGVSDDALVDALIAPVEAQLDDAVASERLTRAEADERLAKARANAEDLIQRVHNGADRHP